MYMRKYVNACDRDVVYSYTVVESMYSTCLTQASSILRKELAKTFVVVALLLLILIQQTWTLKTPFYYLQLYIADFIGLVTQQWQNHSKTLVEAKVLSADIQKQKLHY